MTAAVILVAAIVAAGLLTLLWRGRRSERRLTPSPRRILFPIPGTRLSERTLDAALRLARAEHATLVPAYLAIVPLHLPLDTALTRDCDLAMPMLEAIEQRATRQGVPVDTRVQAGRTYRHALDRLFEAERFDRTVIDAGEGFLPQDVAWLLEHVPGEVLVLRPAWAPPATAAAR